MAFPPRPVSSSAATRKSPAAARAVAGRRLHGVIACHAMSVRSRRSAPGLIKAKRSDAPIIPPKMRCLILAFGAGVYLQPTDHPPGVLARRASLKRAALKMEVTNEPPNHP